MVKFFFALKALDKLTGVVHNAKMKNDPLFYHVKHVFCTTLMSAKGSVSETWP